MPRTGNRSGDFEAMDIEVEVIDIGGIGLTTVGLENSEMRMSV